MNSPSDEMAMSQLPVGLEDVSTSIDWSPNTANQKYSVDPRDRFVGQSVPVFLPKTTQQVSELVAICNTHSIKIVPYGGGTGVVAGQLVFEAENTIQISMEKMNAIRSVSQKDSVLTVEAGCVLADIQSAAEEVDMKFPLSMASEGSSLIGGNLATNCGGIQVLRYGNARDLCLGIEAVLPDGSILNELSPLRKNNTGYDLRHLLIGSEGTLGIITAASLSLKPIDQETVTAFCEVSSPLAALELLTDLQSALGNSVSAFELMSDVGLSIVQRHFPQERFPLKERGTWYVLMEVGANVGITERVTDLLEGAFNSDVLSDAVVANSKSQRDALWRLRELTPEANRLDGAICNSDTSVPLSKVQPFIEQTQRAIADIDPNLTINCYGHVGDGNIHFNVFPPPGRTKKEIVANDPELLNSIRTAISKNTLQFDGAISAEHGIGRLKRTDLETFGDPVKLAVFRAVKQSIDPKGIMNPGVLINC